MGAKKITESEQTAELNEATGEKSIVSDQIITDDPMSATESGRTAADHLRKAMEYVSLIQGELLAACKLRRQHKLHVGSLTQLSRNIGEVRSKISKYVKD
ncbi:MAG: hypothetical protein R3Y68_09030 [Rikenellaceae bacterium]